MRKAKPFTLLVVLFLFLLPPVTTAQEITLPILFDGDVIDTAFEGSGTAHLYAFNATVGDVVTISMVQQTGSDLDPFLVLLGASGQVLASDDDSGEMQFSALIKNYKLHDSGSYFVLASSFIYIDAILAESETLPEPQPYQLTIKGIHPPTELPDFDSDTFTYFRGVLELGGQAQGFSTLEEPVYYYTFSGIQGQQIDILLNSTEFDTLLHVFDSNGKRIAVNNDDSLGNTTNSAIRGFTIPADGSYLIFATDVYFYNAGKTDQLLEFTGGAFTIALTVAK